MSLFDHNFFSFLHSGWLSDHLMRTGKNWKKKLKKKQKNVSVIFNH